MNPPVPTLGRNLRRARHHAALAPLIATLAAAPVGCGPGEPEPEPVDLAQPQDWRAQVAIPEAVDLDPAPATVVLELEAKVVELEVKPGLRTTLWTYNGQLPGPTIRARKGDRLVVRFTNSLPEPTTIHWHGLRVPNDQDGMEPLIQPGEKFEYSFVLPDSGTYWYHPHHRSSAQVGFGLYGALIVEDPADPPLGDDVVLVLSDIGIEADGSLTPADSDGWFGDYFGREGNTLLVNGKILPTLLARQEVPQRWRLVNAARSRYYKFSLPGHTVHRIGGDGGLIERPEPIEELRLVPGERAELYVVPKGPAGELTVEAIDANRFHLPAPAEPEPLMKLRVTEDPPGFGAKPLPEQLRVIAPVDAQSAVKTQGIELMEKSAPGGAVLGINGKTMDESDPLHAMVDTVEVWELTNTTAYDHPFHLHGFSFQVLDVDGRPPAIREWKDTLNVQPKQKIRVAIPFDDRTGHWMFHCHILDHAELGMMGVLMVM